MTEKWRWSSVASFGSRKSLYYGKDGGVYETDAQVCICGEDLTYALVVGNGGDPSIS